MARAPEKAAQGVEQQQLEEARAAKTGPTQKLGIAAFDERPTWSPIEFLVAGALAGGFAKTVTAPADRIRLIYQVTPKASFSVRGAVGLASDLAHRAGAEGLWHGHSATLLRVVPFAGVQFCVYESVLHRFQSGAFDSVLKRDAESASDLSLGTAAPAAAGAIAACAATLATYPSDVLRTRILSQVGPSQSPAYNRNHIAAIEDIVRKEGLGVFIRGLSPTLLGALPYGALSFGSFEFMKGHLRLWHGVAADDEVPMWERLAAGGLGGAAAQLAVYPLNVVRRRMQLAGQGQEMILFQQELAAAANIKDGEKLFRILDRDGSGDLCRAEVEPLAKRLGVSTEELWRRMDTDGSGRIDMEEFRRLTSARDTFRKIAEAEGIAGGLFRGASLTWVKGPVTVGLALVTNDALKSIIHRRHQSHEGDQYVPLPGQGHHGTKQAAGGLKAVESLACGGVAGAIAKTIIAPGDRVKILFQTDATRRFSMSAALQTGGQIVRSEGVRGLWRGHGATLLRVVPYSATSFATFDPYKSRLRDAAPGTNEVLIRFLAGAAAGMTATGLTYPLDALRARMAVQSGSVAYDSYWHAVSTVVRTEGVPSLWSGARPTLMGIVPYSGLSFCIFETLKAKILEIKGSKSTGVAEGPHGHGHGSAGGGGLKSWERLSAGAISGLMAQSATYPLDIIRRRMQVKPQLYTSEYQTVRIILREEGLKGLFKGLSMNWVKGPVAISVSFFVNDTLREWIGAHRR